MGLDFVELLYNGIKEITKDDNPKVSLNFVAEGKVSILLSLLHICVKLPAPGSSDREYYQSFQQFNIKFCDAFYKQDSNPKNSKNHNRVTKTKIKGSGNLKNPSVPFAWIKSNWRKAVALNPYSGYDSWNNHSLILLLNGIFDKEKLFPLNQKLLEAQSQLEMPNQKFFVIEESYINFIAENTGIKYSTEHLGSSFNQFFDQYRFHDFENLVNNNFDFRKFFSLSKKIDNESAEKIKFYLDSDIYGYNIDNYYLAGLLDEFYLFVADRSFLSCLHYLNSHFTKYQQVIFI